MPELCCSSIMEAMVPAPSWVEVFTNPLNTVEKIPLTALETPVSLSPKKELALLTSSLVKGPLLHQLN